MLRIDTSVGSELSHNTLPKCESPLLLTPTARKENLHCASHENATDQLGANKMLD